MTVSYFYSDCQWNYIEVKAKGEAWISSFLNVIEPRCGLLEKNKFWDLFELNKMWGYPVRILRAP